MSERKKNTTTTQTTRDPIIDATFEALGPELKQRIAAELSEAAVGWMRQSVRDDLERIVREYVKMELEPIVKARLEEEREALVDLAVATVREGSAALAAGVKELIEKQSDSIANLSDYRRKDILKALLGTSW